MSTHLEHGYRIPAGTDIPDFLSQVRAALDPVRDRLDARRLAIGATRAIDDAHTNATLYRDPPLAHAYLDYVEEQLHADARSVWQDPNRASVAISHAATDGWHGVLLFASEPELNEVLATVPGVVPYPYWNHTDGPDDLTEDQWSARRDWWNRALPTGVPADSCTTWDLRAGFREGLPAILGNPALVASQVPNNQWRAGRLAQAAVANAAIRGIQDIDAILSLVMRSMRADQYPKVVDAATGLLVAIDADVLTGVTIPVPVDVETLRATFTQRAAAAGARLVDLEARNAD